MKNIGLSVLAALVFCSCASAAPMRFDTFGFEPEAGYVTGDLAGQQGWLVDIEGNASATIVDSTSGVVIGSQALKLEAPGTLADPNNPYSLFADSVIVLHSTTTDPLLWAKVSFDVWRDAGQTVVGGEALANTSLNSLWWWNQDDPNIYGVQWDIDNNIYPHGFGVDAGGTAIVTGAYANVTLLYDYANNKRYSWYNGVMVDDGILLDVAEFGINTFSDIEIYYDQTQPGLAGTYGLPAYIDNLYVEWEAVPEPGSFAALALGLTGLVGFRFRKK